MHKRGNVTVLNFVHTWLRNQYIDWLKIMTRYFCVAGVFQGVMFVVSCRGGGLSRFVSGYSDLGVRMGWGWGEVGWGVKKLSDVAFSNPTLNLITLATRSYEP